MGLLMRLHNKGKNDKLVRSVLPTDTEKQVKKRKEIITNKRRSSILCRLLRVVVSKTVETDNQPLGSGCKHVADFIFVLIVAMLEGEEGGW